MKKIILHLLLIAIYTIGMSSCSKDDSVEVKVPKTFVLVHGAWQAPYVWDAVKSNLEKTGNHLKVVELPGHGTDLTPPQALSIDVYKDKVMSALSEVDGKVILVGHSLGGVIISAVAEKMPSKIEKLIYIGAFLPTSGQSLLDLAQMDTASQLGQSLRPSADQLTLDVVHEKIMEIFIQDGSEDTKGLVLKNYRPEPAIPFTNKLTLTAENYGSVEKVYIKTLQDHVISPALQNQMIHASDIKSVYELNSSHSPFLSQPDSVTFLLEKIAH